MLAMKEPEGTGTLAQCESHIRAEGGRERRDLGSVAASAALGSGRAHNSVSFGEGLSSPRQADS